MPDSVDPRATAEAGREARSAAVVGQQNVRAAAAAGEDAAVLRTAGQRRINLIWEVTQALIAFEITSVAMYAVVALINQGKTDMALQLLSAAFFLIIGFYFTRTNHSKIGGVGPNESGR